MFKRRFRAYAIGVDWWVTIEPLGKTDDRVMRYRWTLRSILFFTKDGTIAPSRDVIARSYSPSVRQARAEAYRAALDACS